MKKTLTSIFSSIALLCTINTNTNAAAITTTTPNLSIICASTNISLTTGDTYEIHFSTDDASGFSPETLTGTSYTIDKTGFYKIYKKDNGTGCLSEPQIIAALVLPPLAPTAVGNTFCIEDVGTATNRLLTSSLTTVPALINGITIEQKWYKGATEVATTASYTPPATDFTTVGTTAYDVKYAYKIGTNYYCPTSPVTANIVVSPKSTTPTITITGETGSATF